jgi:CHAD domain-containing protein/CYTH domain-containing protein
MDEPTTSPAYLPERNILMLPAVSAARLLVSRFADEANTAYERLDNDADEAALHDFRVACRRLRSTIRAFRPQLRRIIPKDVRDAVRDIARASGDSRDIDVSLQWLKSHPGNSPSEVLASSWLTDMMVTRRNSASPGGLREKLSAFPGIRTTIDSGLSVVSKQKISPDAATFAALVAERLDDAARDLEKLLTRINSIADQDEAHRARIAGKRLRYLLEPVEQADPDVKRLVDDLKALQDDVGAMRDANLFRSQISSLLDPESSSIMDPELRDGLAIIAGRLHTDESRAYHRMRSRWSPRANKAFFRRAGDFVRSLNSIGAISHKHIEIERKFLLNALPKRTKGARHVDIEQGWLPGEAFAERLRRARSGGRNKYYRTVKLGSGVRRIELEESTTRAIFDFMWPLTAGKRVAKRRYLIRDAGLTWEIDEFTDRDLIIAEVELDDPTVVPRMPRWLRRYVVRDVTDDPRYLNRNMARYSACAVTFAPLAQCR